MKTSTEQIRAFIEHENESLLKLKHNFILEHVPRFHRLMMEKFPQLKAWYGYAISENEDDPSKLTLLRKKKVLARNFIP